MSRCLVFVALFAPTLAFVACQPLPQPKPTPDADASPAPLPSDPCEAAFQHDTDDLGCEPVKPETGSWINACKNARAHGLTFNVRCFLGANSCDAVRACER